MTGMMHRSCPIRLALTILVITAVPFCCCSFHAWLSACGACTTHSNAGVGEHIAHDPEAHRESHHHDSNHHEADGDSCSGHHENAPSPCCPDDPGNDGCKCGKHDLKMVSVERPTVEFSVPALIAILPWAHASNFEPPVTHFTARRCVWAEARPPTSLLRLHCALVV